MLGGDGNDTIVGAQDDALLDGGGGSSDWLQIGAAFTNASDAQIANIERVEVTASANVNLGLQTEHFAVTGFATGATTFTGGSGNDTFTGGSGNDSVVGGTGDDSITAGPGADRMLGGDGNDTIVGAQDDALLDGGGGTSDWLQVGANFDDLNDAQIANIEKVQVTATGVAVNLGDQTEGFDVAGFLTGATTFVGGAGADIFTGGFGVDSVVGGAENDTLLGFAGNDTLDGGSGDDSLVGGEGGDLYYLDSLDDVIIEVSNQGIDSVLATVSDYTLASQVEYLELLDGVLSGNGNGLANTLVGNSLGNSLDGGIGIDRMSGGDGNDTYFIDNAMDLVVELADQGSSDLIVSSTSGLTLSAQIENLMLSGSATLGTGNSLDNLLSANVLLGSTLYGGGGEDTFVGGAGNDWFIIDSSGDSVEGGLGIDSVQADLDGYTLGGGAEWLIYGTAGIAYGNSLANTLVGNSLANTLNGGEAADSMVGGNGNDYYFVDHIYDVVIETAGGGSSDTINLDVSGYIVPENIENIVTSNNVTSVTGNSAGNALVGNALDNTLDGGLGADTLTGGDGNDYFVVDNLSDVIVESAGTSSGTDTVFSKIGYHALGENVEILLLGSGAVTGVGNSLNNTLIGNAFNNPLFGGAGDDWIDGGSGRNTINGGLGADTMIGVGENDYFVVDNFGDSIMGGGGSDGIISEINSYTLNNAFVALVLGAGVTVGTGNSDNNTLTGNSLNNTLHGGSGEDTLLGDIGNDFYYINSSSDMVIEMLGRGTDTIEVSSVTTYTLANNVERLILGSGAWNGVGNSLNNMLAGNADANSLIGAAGNDSLFGGDNGDDTLLGALASSTGGLGEIDTLTGGAGNDVFVLGTSAGYLYNDGRSTSVGASDYAFITDFTSGSDKLQLVGSSSNYYLGVHSVAGLTAHQGLFRELGATDELIAIIQGSPILALNNTMVNWV